MAKLNVNGLSRPIRKVHGPRHFVDATNPDIAIDVAFQAMDTVDQHKQLERAEELIKLYKTEDENGEKLEFLVGTEIVDIPDTVWHSASMFEIMQVEMQGADMYTADEYARLCVAAPNIWMQLLSAANNIILGSGIKQTKNC